MSPRDSGDSVGLAAASTPAASIVPGCLERFFASYPSVSVSLRAVALPADQRTIARWFNTAAFNTRSTDQLSCNIVALSTRFAGARAPETDMWNMSVVKNFSVTEQFKLQFRAEFLNAFNHTVLAAPNTTATSSAFGSITVANCQPRFIHFGLKLTY